MNRQVVLELGNTHIKAGLIEVSSLPLKKFRSWGKRNSPEKFYSSEEESSEMLEFNEKEHFRALQDNQLHDFDFLLELIEYAVTNELNVQVPLDQVHLTLILPSPLISVQLPFRAKLLRGLYDRLKFAGVFFGEVACMAAMGSAHGTALVLNFDREGVEVAAVNDFCLVAPAIEYLKLNIKSTSDLNNMLTARNSLGLILLDVIESVLQRVDPDRRSITLNNLILNGNPFPAPYQQLCIALQSILLASSIMAVSDYPADTQPAAFAFRSIPEYYIDIKETGVEDIAWFGASLAGKYAHSDAKTFIIPKNSQQQQQQQ